MPGSQLKEKMFKCLGQQMPFCCEEGNARASGGGGGVIAEERACMRVDRLRAVPLFQRGNFKPEGVPQKQKKLLF